MKFQVEIMAFKNKIDNALIEACLKQVLYN